jgi:phosphoglycolate phosphatase/pyrophosphatase PpaX
MKFKVIIFDQDGTIANTLPLIAKSIKNSIKEVTNKDLPFDRIVSFFGPSEDGVLRKMLPEQADKAFAIYLEQYEKMHDELCPTPFPGITDLFEVLSQKGVPICLVTGKSRPATNITLNKFGLDKYFEIIETGSPYGSDKVNGIHRILKQLNLDASDCLYIGDEAGDVRRSREAGVSIASVAWAPTALPEKLKQMNPDYLFYSVEEFKNWILTKV